MDDSTQVQTYQYKYMGERSIELYNPPTYWEPGDVKDVTEPIHHYLFILIEDNKE